MSDEHQQDYDESTRRYIDPNSGAAPQPGGYAGPDHYLDGHGQAPAGVALDDEGAVTMYEGPEVDGELDKFTEEERVDAKMLETQAMSTENAEVEGQGFDPEDEPGELDDFDDDVKVAYKALETQGLVTPLHDIDEVEIFDEDRPSEGEGFEESGPTDAAAEAEAAGEGVGTAPLPDGSDPNEDPADQADQSKDYSSLLEKNVPEIQDYMKDYPDERDAVIAAERARAKDAGDDPRKGVVGS